MIREACIYALKRLPEEEQRPYGIRVLTMRRWPRGVRRKDIDLWVPSAGPSVELLAALHTGQMTWDLFLARYAQEQERQRRCHVITYEQGGPLPRDYTCSSLDHLSRLECERGIVTVLCWEPNARCHRFLLKSLLEQPSAELGAARYLQEESSSLSRCGPGKGGE